MSDLTISWTDAKSTCQSMTGGRGSLAVVDSSAVETGLLPLFTSTGLGLDESILFIIAIKIFKALEKNCLVV